MDLFPCSLLSVFLLIIPAVSAQTAINQTNQTEFMGGPTISTTTPAVVPLVTSQPTFPSITLPVTHITTTPAAADPEPNVGLSTTPPVTVDRALVTTSSVLQSSQSTTSAGNGSCEEPTPSPTWSPTVTSPPQTKIPGITTQTTTIVSVLGSTAATVHSTTSVTYPEGPTGTQTEVSPTESTGNSLTMLAFGVMSLILILIIVMVILVTVVNLRGHCSKSKEDGKKCSDSVVSESNVTSNGEKESITLVSMKTINTETDTDSPQVSSIHSTTLDNEDQELSRDLLNIKLV